jgi:hypothetical protein
MVRGISDPSRLEAGGSASKDTENDTWICLQFNSRRRIAIREPNCRKFPRIDDGATPGNGAFV